MVFVCLVLVTNCVFAQNKHAEFDGVEMGNITEVMNALKAKGYAITNSSSTVALLEGEYYDNDVTVTIFGSKKTKQVYSIWVEFPVENKWNNLKKTYFWIKGLLTDEYKNGRVLSEDLWGVKEGGEMLAVKQGKARFMTIIDIPNGEIEISITDECMVRVMYADTENKKLEKLEN